ncbi:MAG: DUF167 domain-containing protein [Gemmatimonadota bacterium]
MRLKIRVQPRASRTGVVGVHDDALKIRLSSPPVDGAANRELIAYLSKRLRRPKSAIEIESGDRGRLKTVRVNDIDVQDVRAALLPGSP